MSAIPTSSARASLHAVTRLRRDIRRRVQRRPTVAVRLRIQLDAVCRSVRDCDSHIAVGHSMSASAECLRVSHNRRVVAPAVPMAPHAHLAPTCGLTRVRTIGATPPTWRTSASAPMPPTAPSWVWATTVEVGSLGTGATNCRLGGHRLRCRSSPMVALGANGSQAPASATSGKRPAALIRRVELASRHRDDRAEMDVAELTLRALDREAAAPAVSAPVPLALPRIGGHPLLGLLA